MSDHIGLVIAVAVLWLLLVIAFFILGAICEGATIRASAEHDAERSFHLGWAWRSGLTTMWVIARFRLLLIALALPLLVLAFGLGFGLVLALANGNRGATVGLILGALLFVVIAIPYLIYLFFLDRLGSRAAVLEQLAARASIVRAHRLLFKRFGRSLLVWLISILVGIVLGIVLACFALIVFVPLAIVGAVLYAGGSGAAWLVLALAILIFLPVDLVIAAFLAAQSSTYWTLAFRRLDLEQAPYQAPPPPPQVTS